MAAAGYPYRQETFYYSHRKGGWQYNPYDVTDLVRSAEDAVIPIVQSMGIEVPRVKALGQTNPGWFFNREPLFSVTGASAVVSMMEPLLLQAHYGMQFATALLSGARKGNSLPETFPVSCQQEKDILLDVVARLKYTGSVPRIEVRTEEYAESVYRRMQQLLHAVGGDASRVFEVGLRAASCPEQHRIALQAMQAAGLQLTSSTIAPTVGLKMVGTMGHEHIMRFGSDYAAFTAMRDRTSGFVSYLLDTFDTMNSGIPSAYRAIAECPDRPQGIRFDSESNIRSHYYYAHARAKEADLNPTYILESGWDLNKTIEFELLREQLKIPPEKQIYGLGGYLVAPPWDHFGRDKVSAVYKLSQSGGVPTMKFGDEPEGGKSSIPGRPLLLRTAVLSPATSGKATGIVAQEGEVLDLDLPLHRGAAITYDDLRVRPGKVVYSPETKRLIAMLGESRKCR